jgi:hypothetical protein
LGGQFKRQEGNQLGGTRYPIGQGVQLICHFAVQ